MTLDSTYRPMALSALALTAVLGVSACGGGEDPDSTADGAASQADEQPSAEPETEETGPEDEGTGPLEVDTTGEGPIGLSASSPKEADVTEVSGKLITGPGSCFALSPDDQPQLLVFPEDADFQTERGRPAVTSDGIGTVEVGEQMELTAVEYSGDDVTGIPDQCAEGADDTVLVVVE